MVRSRVFSSAGESWTKTATAMRRPSGREISPTSLVAAVLPLRVSEVPVLCATGVAGGSAPLSRSGR